MTREEWNEAIGADISKGIFLDIIRKRYPIFGRIGKIISDRIFRTLGLLADSATEKMN